jgi:hypothetical protein
LNSEESPSSPWSLDSREMFITCCYFLLGRWFSFLETLPLDFLSLLLLLTHFVFLCQRIFLSCVLTHHFLLQPQNSTPIHSLSLSQVFPLSSKIQALCLFAKISRESCHVYKK